MTAPHTYITTTIPYVNARPHIGFALELVQADVLARHARDRGDRVRLQAGTDDNSLKNVLAAQAAGVGVAEFVDRNADAFAALGDALSLNAGRCPEHETVPQLISEENWFFRLSLRVVRRRGRGALVAAAQGTAGGRHRLHRRAAIGRAHRHPDHAGRRWTAAEPIPRVSSPASVNAGDRAPRR